MAERAVILLWILLFVNLSGVESLNDESYDVLILGAGVAGISAAKALQEGGNFDYLVLEARNRTGGRVHSVDFDGNVIDLGAEFIVGHRNNPVFDIGHENGVLEETSRSGSPVYLAHSDGSQIDLHAAAAVMTQEEYMRAFHEMKEFRGSYWDYMWPHLRDELKHRGEEVRLESWEDLLRKILAANHQGNSVLDLGAKGVSQRRIEGHTMTTWKNGYSTLLEILMGKMNSGEVGNGIEGKIRLNKEAVSVEYSDSGVTVSCSDGSTYRSKKLVVTLPLGVLKNLPNDFWTPRLPDNKRRAIQGFEISSMNKIFLKFRTAVWPSYLKEFAIGFTSDDKAKLQNNSAPWLLDIAEFLVAKHNSNLLQIVVIGRGANDLESASDGDITNGTMKILKLMFPKNADAHPPTHIYKTKWNSDRFSRGSQCYRSVQTDKDDITAEDFSKPIEFNQKPVIIFAGEATHPHYFGTVHGAYLSGIAAANSIK